MKKILKINLNIFLIIIVLFSLSACGKSKDKEKNLEEKINTEISYVDSELLSIANSLNNIDYAKYKVVTQEAETSSGGSQQGGQSESSNGKSSEEQNQQQSSGSEGSDKSSQSGGSQESEGSDKNSQSSESGQGSKSSSTSSKIFSMQANNILGKQEEINWDDLKNKIEELYTTWIIVSIDLKTVEVSEEHLNKFSENMDAAAKAIKNEDKSETMNAVIGLYELLPKFVEKYSEQNKQKDILDTKYNLLVCYQCADSEKWDEFENSLSNLKMSFSNVSNKREEYKGKEININSALTIISEMNNTINTQDKDIFLIKYKNLIEELNVILSV